MLGRNGLTLLLLLLFVLEGSVIKWLLPLSWQEQVMISPHLTLVAIMLISIYDSRRIGLLYGLCFGLLHDIVYYGPMIGPYCLGMGIVSYLCGVPKFRYGIGLFISLFLIAAGNLLFEWILYGIYQVTQVRPLDMHWAFLHLMLPSLFMNALFALILYVPMRRLLDKLRKMEKSSKE
ncbi:rod shape-determining protein MreD [Paenibacillus senegalensis]|uniref:rod shape-determining protein MreD n=1 Tax=Paenibacillus senegalensis TaxID=1465766 RepID=UPI00028A3988|nr:rod shape-determining protein MreD [Paenibacillus senegalensis]